MGLSMSDKEKAVSCVDNSELIEVLQYERDSWRRVSERLQRRVYELEGLLEARAFGARVAEKLKHTKEPPTNV